MRPILVLQHEPASSAALVGEYLTEAGFELDVRHLGEGDATPAPDDLYDRGALIVLGGDMNVDEEHDHPFLVPERLLLAEAVRRGLPTLGICLGAQQLALATGGDVYRRAEPLIGWHPIEFHARDGLVDGLHPQPVVFSWRAYTCRAPDEAQVLAYSPGDGEPQIFRVGESAWGLLFHPEVDRKLLLGWIDGDRDYLDEVLPEGAKGLRAMSKRELLRSAMFCGQLMANFLAVGRVRER